jgi:hypothetical protein
MGLRTRLVTFGDVEVAEMVDMYLTRRGPPQEQQQRREVIYGYTHAQGAYLLTPASTVRLRAKPLCEWPP